MHIPDSVQDSRNIQHLTNPRRRISQRQRTGLLLAIAIVNSTSPGTSILDRLRQILREREELQEQQRCIDATTTTTSSTTTTTNSQKAPSPPRQDQEENGTLARRESFSPDRTNSPSPRLAEQQQQPRQQQTQQEQQQQQLGSSGTIAGSRGLSWEVREKQLEAEIDALRRWKLNHLLEVDRERLRGLEMTDACIHQDDQQKATMKRKRLDRPLGSSQGSVGDGSGSNSDSILLHQQHEAELLGFKHRLLSHLEVVRQNQFFLEQATTSKKQMIETDTVEMPSMLWNVSMTSHLIQAVKEATLMLCSPIIQSGLSEKAYLHTMDAVQTYMKGPYLTLRQYNNILQGLESSWEQILLPILSGSSELHTEMSTMLSPSAFSIARFGIAAQYQTRQEHQQLYSEGLPHQTRCLGSLLRVLLKALAQTVDRIQQSIILHDQKQQEQQQRFQSQVGGGGEGQFGRRTRQGGKAKAAGRVEQARRRLAERQVLRQRQQQLEERCGQMVDIACDLLSAYRQSCSLMAKLMDVSKDSASTDNYSRASVSHNDADELKRVEDDCNRLMGCVCSKVLSSSDVSTTAVRPARRGISVWLTERMHRLVSIDCFQ